ncbi:MAG: hypothetical protein R2883_05490 [Caldisericia bacterium]
MGKFTKQFNGGEKMFNKKLEKHKILIGLVEMENRIKTQKLSNMIFINTIFVPVIIFIVKSSYIMIDTGI